MVPAARWKEGRKGEEGVEGRKEGGYIRGSEGTSIDTRLAPYLLFKLFMSNTEVGRTDMTSDKRSESFFIFLNRADRQWRTTMTMTFPRSIWTWT
jgi:hypothetical protein